MEALLFFIVLFAVMYFVTIRPQQKRVREQRELVRALQVGDEVVTAGGLIGRVVSLDDMELLLDSSGTKIRVARVAVTQVIDDDLPDDES
jgi:preprotein translocase subunit YajC